MGRAVGSCDVDLAGGGVEVDGPPSFVDLHVVVAAHQEQVFDAGDAAVVPVVQVVGVGPRCRGGAAGPTTAAIAGVEGAADPVRDEPVGAADVEG